MTNLPVKVGKGVLSVYPPQKKLDILEKLGRTVYVPSEEDMDRFCALIGCGSGFCYNILEMYQNNSKVLNMVA